MIAEIGSTNCNNMEWGTFCVQNLHVVKEKCVNIYDLSSGRSQMWDYCLIF